MKTFTLLAVAAVATSAFGQAVRIGGGYEPDSPYNRLYNRNHEVTFTGKVTGKLYNSPIKGMEQGMTLLVKTPKNGTQSVELGPRWFVAQQVAKVNLGDRVKVIGSPARLNGSNVIMAKQIVNSKNAVLALRDLSGQPYWSIRRTPSAVAQAPDNAISGTILSSSTVPYDNVPMASYVLQTPTGNVNFVTAPTWYWGRQGGNVLPIGSQVQIVGSAGVYRTSPNVYVADSVYSGGNVYVLRNGGIPVWNGWTYVNP